MKKIAAISAALLVLLPAAAFAGFLDLSVGVIAELNTPIALESMEPYSPIEDLTADDITFGIDSRLSLSILESSSKIWIGSDWWGFYTGGGIKLSLLDLIDIGINAGPYFEGDIVDGEPQLNQDPEDPSTWYVAGQITADLNLGAFSIGTYVWIWPYLFSSSDYLIVSEIADSSFDPSDLLFDGYFGVSARIKLL
jgi:hypothetical protein